MSIRFSWLIVLLGSTLSLWSFACWNCQLLTEGVEVFSSNSGFVRFSLERHQFAFPPSVIILFFCHNTSLYALVEHFLLCSCVTSPLCMVVAPIPGSALPEMIVAIHCLSLLSCCWDKHHGQMQQWRGNGFSSLQLTVHHWAKSGQGGVQELGQKPRRRNAVPGSLLGLGSSRFIIQPGPPAEGWALQHQSSMKMPSHRQGHRPVLSRQLINWGFLFPGDSRLCQSWQ